MNLLNKIELYLRLFVMGKHPNNTPFNYNWTFIYPLKSELKKNKDHVKGVIVDIGAGPAPYFNYFEDNVEHYYGIDFSYDDEKKQVSEKLTFVKALAEETPFVDNFADTVISNQFLYAHPEPDKVIAEISRILKPSGKMILTTPHSQVLITEPYDYFRFTPNYFKFIAEKYGYKIIMVKPSGDIFTSFACALSMSLVLNKYDGTEMRLVRFKQWFFAGLIFVVNISCFILDKIFRFTRNPANLFVIMEKE